MPTQRVLCPPRWSEYLGSEKTGKDKIKYGEEVLLLLESILGITGGDAVEERIETGSKPRPNINDSSIHGYDFMYVAIQITRNKCRAPYWI